MNSRKPDEDELAMYAGRWVACLGRRIIGQGGTPEQALLAANATRFKERAEVIYVPFSQPFIFSDLYQRVARALPDDTPVYLIGGSVRDAMLGRPVHDLDFVLPGEVFKIARRVANEIGAAFYPMDEERFTARLIFQEKNGRRQIIDFSNFRGPDLESDLRLRDFTVNAMALDVHQPQALLDPLGGASDLRAKLLRACSPTSFTDDPLRVLRGIRLAASFGFRIQLETRQLMRQAVDLLPRVSPERVRDELFKILEGPVPATSLRALEILGVFPYILPELPALKGVDQSAPHIYDVWAHTLGVVQKLDEVLQALHPDYNPEAAANFSLGLAVLQLGRFRHHIGEHFKESLNPDRTLRALVFLAALYHDSAKPNTARVDDGGRIRFFNHDQEGAVLVSRRAQALHLSNVEIERLSTIVRHHLRPILLAQGDEQPTRRAVYRFFRDTGKAGVDICLLSLADVLATYGPSLPTDHWARHLEVVRGLLEAWWEQREERVLPPVLLTGHDLIEHFSLESGPQIGELLEAVREAQAAGQVKDRQEALQIVRDLLGVDLG